MELVKNFTQSKLVKNLFIALIGSILLAISSKIKISGANANLCVGKYHLSVGKYTSVFDGFHQK